MKSVDKVNFEQQNWHFVPLGSEQLNQLAKKISQQVCLTQEEVTLLCDTVSQARESDVNNRYYLVDLVFAVLSSHYPKDKPVMRTDDQLLECLTAPGLFNRIQCTDESVILISQKLEKNSGHASKLLKLIAKNQEIPQIVQQSMIDFARGGSIHSFLDNKRVTLGALKHCYSTERLMTPETAIALNELVQHFKRGKSSVQIEDGISFVKLTAYNLLARNGYGQPSYVGAIKFLHDTAEDPCLKDKASKLMQECSGQYSIFFGAKYYTESCKNWSSKTLIEKEKYIIDTVKYLRLFSDIEHKDPLQGTLNTNRLNFLTHIVKDEEIDFGRLKGVTENLRKAIEIGCKNDFTTVKTLCALRGVKGKLNKELIDSIIARLPLSEGYDFKVLSELEKNLTRIAGASKDSLEKLHFMSYDQTDQNTQALASTLLNKLSIRLEDLSRIEINSQVLPQNISLLCDQPGVKTRTELTEELLKFNSDNHQIRDLVLQLDNKLALIDEFWQRGSKLAKSELLFDKRICNYSELDIKLWAKELKEKKESISPSIEEHVAEVLAVISRGVMITNSYAPRYVQKQAVLILFDSVTKEHGRLTQIKTGEGKSTITAMLAVAEVILLNKQVDIITSSAPLAERDASEQALFYNLFNLSCGCNISKKTDSQKGLKECYKSDIVYGDTLSFQADLLRSEFKQSGARGTRQFDAVIIDEVDSMLIDEGSRIAKLATPICGMEHLAPLFIFISKHLQYSSVDSEALSNTQFYETIKHQIEELISQILDHQSGVIKFPRYLADFVYQQIPIWAETALRAITMQENIDYVIANDSNGLEGEKVIAPVDYVSTGVVQSSTTWAGGLHQFLQVKHELRITAESLTTSFISNMGYFKRYGNNICGLTGTLGSSGSKELLQNIYNIDLAYIPTFKPKIFKEYIGQVTEDRQSHLESIVRSALEETDKQRSVLIIAETIADALEITQRIKEKNFQGRIKQYLRSDYEGGTQDKFDGKSDSGDIIVATNLAGRGTDITTTDSVEKVGGMHVIIGFLPVNLRVQEQAFGRTSRQGNNGSGEIIINGEKTSKKFGIPYLPEVSLLELQKLRDDHEQDNLQITKTQLVQKITFEDGLFQRFNNEIYQPSRLVDNNTQKLLQLEDLWGFWLERVTKRYDIASTQGQEQISQTFAELKNSVLELYGDANCYNIMNNPAYFTNLVMNKLGDDPGYNEPCRLLERAITLDDDYSYQAHYLRAYSLLRHNNTLNNGTQSSARSRNETINKALESFDMARQQIENIVIPQLQSAMINLGAESIGSPLHKQLDNKLRLLTTTATNIAKNIEFIKNSNNPNSQKIKVAEGSLQLYMDLFRSEISVKDIQEYGNFGMHHIFDVTAQKIDKDHFSGTLVATIGVAQVVVGAMIAIGSAGFAAEFGVGLAVGGVSDIISGMQHALKGQTVDFDQWLNQKAIEIAVTLATAGISSKINGTKGVKVGTQLGKETGKKAVQEMALRQFCYEVGKSLAMTQLVRIAATGIERSMAKPIKGAAKELATEIRQLFLEQELREKLRHIMVMDVVTGNSQGGSGSYIASVEKAVMSLLDQKRSQFEHITQSLVTTTLSASNPTSATLISIGSTAYTVGREMIEIENLREFLCQEIPIAIDQIYRSLPDLEFMLHRRCVFLSHHQIAQIAEKLMTSRIIDRQMNVNEQLLGFNSGGIGKKVENESIVQNLPEQHSDSSKEVRKFEFEELSKKGTSINVSKEQLVLQLPSNHKSVTTISTNGKKEGEIDLGPGNGERVRIVSLLRDLHQAKATAARGEYDGQIEGVANNIAGSVGHRMRGMVKNGIITPITGQLVSRTVQHVLDQYQVDSVMRGEKIITGVAAGGDDNKPTGLLGKLVELIDKRNNHQDQEEINKRVKIVEELEIEGMPWLESSDVSHIETTGLIEDLRDWAKYNSRNKQLGTSQEVDELVWYDETGTPIPKLVQPQWQPKTIRDVGTNLYHDFVDPRNINSKYYGNLPLAIISTGGELMEYGGQQFAHLISCVEGGQETLSALGYAYESTLGRLKGGIKYGAKLALTEKQYSTAVRWYYDLPHGAQIVGSVVSDGVILYGAGTVLKISASGIKPKALWAQIITTPVVGELRPPRNHVLKWHKDPIVKTNRPALKQGIETYPFEQRSILHKSNIDFAANKAVQETIGYQPVVQGGYSEAVALRLKEACHDLYSKPRREAKIIAGVGSKESINDIARITQTYGGSKNDWVKFSSKQIEFNEGRLIPERNIGIELHWYENIKTGKKVEVKPKIKNDKWETQK